MTFGDQGLTTTRARQQPLMSMRVFIAFDRIEPFDPGKSDGCLGTYIACVDESEYRYDVSLALETIRNCTSW